MDLNYKTFGQGDPIVILHGLFGTLDNWQTIARKLAEDHTVYIVDQRNHGRSPHLDEINYELMAEDLRQFMEDHWIYHAHIMGHSMGGKTAMRFALDHPDMVDRLIIVDIAPRAYPPGHETIFEALLGLDLSHLESRSDAEEWLKPHVPDFAVRQFLLKNLTRDKEHGYQWKMNLPVIHQHYEDILGPIESDEPYEGPALFLKGTRSPYIREEDHALICQMFPHARIESIERAGHWLHSEQPEFFLRRVSVFLKEKDLV